MWKQTNGRTDGWTDVTYFFTFLVNAVGKNSPTISGPGRAIGLVFVLYVFGRAITFDGMTFDLNISYAGSSWHSFYVKSLVKVHGHIKKLCLTGQSDLENGLSGS